MIRIELTRADADRLVRLLDHWLGEMRMEIADTDKQDFRNTLHEEKRVVERLLHQIESAEDTGPEVRLEERA